MNSKFLREWMLGESIHHEQINSEPHKLLWDKSQIRQKGEEGTSAP